MSRDDGKLSETIARFIYEEPMTPAQQASARGDLLASMDLGAEVPVDLPAGLGWDSTSYPFSFWISDSSKGPAYGRCSHTPAQAFDLFSTARSAPAATFYVSSSMGNDSNNGTTVGTPVASIWKAISLANTAAVASTIFVTAGRYTRTNNPGNGNPPPTVDIALVATGGRVVTGTFDDFTAPSLDATYTLCYSYAVTNIARVVDTFARNRHGNYNSMINVASPALCNATPNSWHHTGSTIYIRRGDGSAVTNANTRVYRTTSSVLRLDGRRVSLFLAGQTQDDGWDFEGGDTEGCLNILSIGGSVTVKRAVVAENCTFKYSGSPAAPGAGGLRNGVAIQHLNGLAYFSNCEFSETGSDGFNAHNYDAAAVPAVLTINCRSRGCGEWEFGNQSCNAWTLHETTVGIDIAGDYGWSHGGCVRNINSTKALMAGTSSGPDMGDMVFSGAVVPSVSFRVDDTAQLWLYRTKEVGMPGNEGLTALGTSKIYCRDPWPSPLKRRVAAGALITNY